MSALEGGCLLRGGVSAPRGVSALGGVCSGGLVGGVGGGEAWVSAP